jgi:sulfatase maturation enzyme AslB (radical SAM superfamily)
LGNIRERRFRSIFRENEFWDLMCNRDERLHHCEVCEFKHYCGGCRARADAYHGVVSAGDPGCVFNQRHWDKLIGQGVEEEERAAALRGMADSEETHASRVVPMAKEDGRPQVMQELSGL